MEERQEYLVLAQIGGAGDPEVWQPGSKIWLTDKAAAAHLASANICKIDELPAESLDTDDTHGIAVRELPTAEPAIGEPPTRRRRAKVEVEEEPTMEVST